jgi:aspartyl-tRNA(Asn)/glutamyl-tRNA(Gln) amidotransferase subunit C
MPVDKDTVRRVARLARIAVSDDEIEALQAQLNGILNFVEQLREVDVSGVEPMTTVVAATTMKMRDDVVTDGGKPAAVIANAPTRAENFFQVPKVVE